jgi:O-antigen/teichoic acid export membrane protein
VTTPERTAWQRLLDQMRRGSVLLASGGLISAAIAWLVLVLVARLAGPVDYEEFVIVWSVYFAAAGVLVGLQQQVVRALGTPGRSTEVSATRLGPGVLGVGTRAGLVVVPLAVLAFGVALDVGTAQTVTVAVVVACGTVVLVLASVVLGVLAADARWSVIAGVGVGDQVVRGVAVLVVVVVGPSPITLVLAVFAGLVAFAPLLRLAAPRRMPEVEAVVFGRRAYAAMVSTGCANILIVGLPFLVELTGETPAGVTASLFAAIYLTRSPLLVPANALRPMVLRLLLEHRTHLVRWVTTRLAPATGVALVLAAAGGHLVGPALLGLVFGPDFELSGPTMAALVMAAVLMLGLTLTGMAMVALDRDVAATAGWIATTVITITVLSVPVGVVERCVLAMVAGPATGMVVHLIAIARTPSRAEASHPAPRRPPHDGEVGPTTKDPEH